MKLGLQFRYQNGQVQVNHNHFLGYTKDADENLIIDPEQAEVVKRIYREYLEGILRKNIKKFTTTGIYPGSLIDASIHKIISTMSFDAYPKA